MRKWPMAVEDGPPVPWVALWSSEMKPIGVDGAKTTVARFDANDNFEGVFEFIKLTYTDAKVDEKMRDRHGLLWMGFARGQGDGKPVYSAFHTLRQRRALKRGHWVCQVCRRGMGKPTWVLTDSGNDAVALHKLTGADDALGSLGLDEIVVDVPCFTPTAPTCLDCFESFVQSHCPHVMAAEWIFVEAEDTKPYAYFGDVGSMSGDDFKMKTGAMLLHQDLDRLELVAPFLARMIAVELVEPLVVMRKGE